MKVVVIGASDKPHRYSYQAICRLLQQHHSVYPVHPRLKVIEGIPVYNKISDIHDKIDTVTMYVGAAHSNSMIDEIMGLHPARIIFNPGAENEELSNLASSQGIIAINACTLVLLTTGQF